MTRNAKINSIIASVCAIYHHITLTCISVANISEEQYPSLSWIYNFKEYS